MTSTIHLLRLTTPAQECDSMDLHSVNIQNIYVYPIITKKTSYVKEVRNDIFTHFIYSKLRNEQRD